MAISERSKLRKIDTPRPERDGTAIVSIDLDDSLRTHPTVQIFLDENSPLDPDNVCYIGGGRSIEEALDDSIERITFILADLRARRAQL